MFSSPFGTNLQDLQQNYYQQLAAMQQMQNNSNNVLEEINKVVASMSSDEQSMMAESPEYIMAKQTYEAGFMGFLGQKFSQEYINTQEGKTAASNLLSSIKKYPKSPNVKEAILFLARTCEAKADRTKAKAYYQKVISMPPMDNFSKEANARISKL